MEQDTKFKAGKTSVFSVAYTARAFACFSGEVSIWEVVCIVEFQLLLMLWKSTVYSMLREGTNLKKKLYFHLKYLLTYLLHGAESFLRS